MFNIESALANDIASRLDMLSDIVLFRNSHEIRYYCSCGGCDGGCQGCAGCTGPA